jgi:hypothetical protein
MMDATSGERTWLVLAHQLPPSPPGLRVRVWRRLQALGALPLKNSVYVLPDDDERREDFEWLMREIEAAGADATLFRATFAAGVTDEECVDRFRSSAAAEYAALVEDLREAAAEPRGKSARAEHVEDIRRRLPRLGERFAAIERRDFFGAAGHEAAAALLADLEHRAEAEMNETGGPSASATRPVASLAGKIWVTRAGVRVDRTASAWLIRRFVDPAAAFRFVDSRRHTPSAREVRFDMFGGEFTHEGDSCTFETLVRRLGLDAPGLGKLAEIVHDLDLKDDRYGHAETAGVGAMIDGLAATTSDDLERIEKARPLFDGLLARFARSR